MKSIAEMMFDSFADFFKIMFVALFVIIIGNYLLLNIMTYQIMDDAERLGYFRETKVHEVLNAMNQNVNAFRFDLNPAWNCHAPMLGAPMQLTLTKKFNYTIFRRAYSMDMVVKKVGISKAYSNINDYGNYNLE